MLQDSDDNWCKFGYCRTKFFVTKKDQDIPKIDNGTDSFKRSSTFDHRTRLIVEVVGPSG